MRHLKFHRKLAISFIIIVSLVFSMGGSLFAKNVSSNGETIFAESGGTENAGSDKALNNEKSTETDSDTDKSDSEKSGSTDSDSDSPDTDKTEAKKTDTDGLNTHKSADTDLIDKELINEELIDTAVEYSESLSLEDDTYENSESRGWADEAAGNEVELLEEGTEEVEENIAPIDLEEINGSETGNETPVGDSASCNCSCNCLSCNCVSGNCKGTCSCNCAKCKCKGSDDDEKDTASDNETPSDNNTPSGNTTPSANDTPDEPYPKPDVNRLVTKSLGTIGGKNVEARITNAVVYDGRKQVQSPGHAKKDAKPSKTKAASISVDLIVDGQQVPKGYLTFSFKNNKDAGIAWVIVKVDKDAYDSSFSSELSKFFRNNPKALTFEILPVDIKDPDNFLNFDLKDTEVKRDGFTIIKAIRKLRYRFNYDELAIKKNYRIVTLKYNPEGKKDFQANMVGTDGLSIHIEGNNNYTGEVTAGVDEIALKKYTSVKKEITIPATAVIKGTSYHTVLLGSRSNENPTFPGTVSSISIAKGVKAGEDIQYLFYGCNGLTKLDLTNLDMSSVKDARYLFSGCKSLKTIVLGSFVKEENNPKLDKMFEGCESLKLIKYSGKKEDWIKLTAGKDLALPLGLKQIQCKGNENILY